jgi:hypothetical protein
MCPDAPTLNFDVSDMKDPLDLYRLFLTNNLLDLIVEETNRYARQCLEKGTASKSRSEILE